MKNILISIVSLGTLKVCTPILVPLAFLIINIVRYSKLPSTKYCSRHWGDIYIQVSKCRLSVDPFLSATFYFYLGSMPLYFVCTIYVLGHGGVLHIRMWPSYALTARSNNQFFIYTTSFVLRPCSIIFCMY